MISCCFCGKETDFFTKIVDTRWEIYCSLCEMLGHAGDWLIQGIVGELYPCKSDIFAKSYKVIP